NLWATMALREQVVAGSAGQPAPFQEPPRPQLSDRSGEALSAANDARDTFAEALYALLADRSGPGEWDQLREPLMARYEQAAREHKGLRLRDANRKGKEAVGAVVVLSERSTRRIEDAIRKALLKRGYDAELVNVACQRVRELLLEEVRKEP